MNVLKPHLQTTVWTLLDAGASQREIERVTGIDRKTIRAYQKRFAAAAANSPGVATGCLAQFPPPRPPALRVAAAAATVSACEPHRAFIEAQLRLRRNATAVYQDLVDQFGFTGAYGSVKRFVRHLRQRERPLLQPLPTLGMQFFTDSQRTVCAPGRRRGRHRRLRLGAGHAAADDRGRARPGLMHSLVSAQPTQERREDADRHHYRDQPATTERVGDAVRMSVHCPARRSGCPACCHAAYFAGSLRRP